MGNVVGVSIEDVLSKAALRRDTTIMWINPEQPLLASLTHMGTHLILDKAAPTSAVGRVIAYSGKLAGILGHLVSHDVRSGSAYDAANSVERPTGYATPEVARSLGQSRHSFEKGVTDWYVSSSTYDHLVESSTSPAGSADIWSAKNF